MLADRISTSALSIRNSVCFAHTAREALWLNQSCIWTIYSICYVLRSDPSRDNIPLICSQKSKHVYWLNSGHSFSRFYLSFSFFSNLRAITLCVFVFVCVLMCEWVSAASCNVDDIQRYNNIWIIKCCGYLSPWILYAERLLKRNKAEISKKNEANKRTKRDTRIITAKLMAVLGLPLSLSHRIFWCVNQKQ